MYGTKEYWDSRYKSGGSSGEGSYGRLRDHKSYVINQFALSYGISGAIDLGCGDGNQLSSFQFQSITGFDISSEAIKICKNKFQGDDSKKFEIYSPAEWNCENKNLTSLSLSLDVLFCILEDDLFHVYLTQLFDLYNRFVIIYSDNTNEKTDNTPYIKHRNFTDWVKSNRPDWTLAGFLPNRFPVVQGENGSNKSFCNFYIYSRHEKLNEPYAMFNPDEIENTGKIQSLDDCQKFMNLSQISFQNGKFEETIESIKQIIAFQNINNCLDVKTFINYALVHSAYEKYKEAEEIYKTALAFYPTNQEVRLNLAKLYLKNQNYENLKYFENELLSLLSTGTNIDPFLSKILENIPELLSNTKFTALMDKCGVKKTTDFGTEEDMNYQTVIPGEFSKLNSPSNLLPTYINFLNSNEFLPKLNRLLQNFDLENKSKLCRIIHNLQDVAANTPPEKIFTKEECIQINSLKEQIAKRTVKINDNLFCYNGYFLPVSHIGPDVFINRMGLNMLENPQNLRNKDIIDAGGYCGDSAILLSEATNAKVYVFEPIDNHQKLIEQTLNNNNVTNCVLVPFALGECTKETVIYFFDSGSSINKFDNYAFKDKMTQYKIQMVSLDEYVFQNNLNVGFIKVDIEGYEQQFLKGAMKTIKEMRPALSISIYHNSDDFFNIKPLLESLDLGYKFKISKAADGNIVTETALIAEVY
jgi:FkbM family methyltransferase